MIRWVDDILEQKSEQSPFAVEEEPSAKGDDAVSFDWIHGPGGGGGNCDDIETETSTPVALRTSGAPLLDAKSIAMIREAAENLWDGRNNDNKEQVGASSRFTLQFEETNSECHLDELVASDPTGNLKDIVDDLLTNKVYPLVRKAFGSDADAAGHNGLTDGRLCVYDSLVVRYNGDKATDRFGASQPLHGDGGVVSVNIALNPHSNNGGDVHGDSFSGGGTFFEDLIRDDIENPLNDTVSSGNGNGNDNDNGNSCGPILRPSATGHGLAHWSTKRHAGAPTSSGTRDILVIFLTQRRADKAPSFSGIERSFHLKLKARELPSAHRGTALRCLDMAIEENPLDAQAHFWKGFHLMQGMQQERTTTTAEDSVAADAAATEEEEQQRWQEIDRGVYHLVRATECAPFDANMNCCAGTARRQRWMFAQRTQRLQNGEEDEIGEVTGASGFLERALVLHEHYKRHGISSDFGDKKAAAARLTLGEIYAQLERYNDAVECLTRIIEGFDSPGVDSDGGGDDETVSEAMAKHVSGLIAHCQERARAREEEREGRPELEP